MNGPTVRETTIAAPADDVPVGAAFITLFTFAQIAAYLSFVPLLSILLPLKAEQIDSTDKAGCLAAVAVWGAAAALVANPLAGAISDGTASRFGRRRPWILAGACATAASYLFIMAAATRLDLILAFCGFQLAFNMMFSPLNAVVPDRIPDRQKGLVSGLVGLGNPIGAIIGAFLVGRVLDGTTARFGAIALILLVGAVPFALFGHEPPSRRSHRSSLAATLRSFWIDPRRHPDFARTWVARLLVLIAYSVVTGYMLFYLQDAVHYARLFPGGRAEAGIATLTAISATASVVSTMVCGYLSDRLGRRRIFVIGAGVLMAAAMAVFALMPTWHGMIAGYVVFGLGIGGFFAVDIALIAQVLPSVDDAGKHLGVINLTNMIGQAVAPLLAVRVLAASGGDYPLLFGIAAAIALLGSLAVLTIRSVR